MSGIAVIGVGYVGLCSAAGFAALGHRVKCFDVNLEKIEKLKEGSVPIFEQGLDSLILEGMEAGNLSFHTEIKAALSESKYVFICVPTPQDTDGAADLSYVLSAAEHISPLLQKDDVVVVKSTVPVGAAERVRSRLARSDVSYVSNPEFLREGSAIKDFFNPDRIVVGSESRDSALAVANLYRHSNAPVVVTSAASAELIKYAANSFLAIKLSFINEVAGLCERVGANIDDVSKGFGLDSRIGSEFLKPGPGWGGSCFPKDTKALLHTTELAGIPSALISAAITSNQSTFQRIVDRLAFELGGGLEGCSIAVWGLAFKANTDDIRESPSIEIISRLLARGAKVTVYDPVATAPVDLGVFQVESPIHAVSGADALLVLTEWSDFESIEPNAVLREMNQQVVFDARGILNESWNDLTQVIRVGH